MENKNRLKFWGNLALAGAIFASFFSGNAAGGEPGKGKKKNVKLPVAEASADKEKKKKDLPSFEDLQVLKAKLAAEQLPYAHLPAPMIVRSLHQPEAPVRAAQDIPSYTFNEVLDAYGENIYHTLQNNALRIAIVEVDKAVFNGKKDAYQDTLADIEYKISAGRNQTLFLEERYLLQDLYQLEKGRDPKKQSIPTPGLWKEPKTMREFARVSTVLGEDANLQKAERKRDELTLDFLAQFDLSSGKAVINDFTVRGAPDMNLSAMRGKLREMAKAHFAVAKIRQGIFDRVDAQLRKESQATKVEPSPAEKMRALREQSSPSKPAKASEAKKSAKQIDEVQSVTENGITYEIPTPGGKVPDKVWNFR